MFNHQDFHKNHTHNLHISFNVKKNYSKEFRRLKLRDFLKELKALIIIMAIIIHESFLVILIILKVLEALKFKLMHSSKTILLLMIHL